MNFIVSFMIRACIVTHTDGTDAYENAKKIGRFKLIKRTEGVSSTDIVGRMLMCTRNNPRLGAEVNSCPLTACLVCS